VARTLHQLSLRFDKPFVAVNCAALPESLVESELFGHERGAFTGAASRRVGRFESSDGGTLFIDEVGDLPVSVQVKLLRVLQEGTFERVGANETLRCDVRVLAATHRNLEEMIEDGRFREDLYYRLAVVPVMLPPLRERPEDILPLALHHLDTLQRRAGKERIQISERMRAALVEHTWPGNVRELMNVIERAVALTPTGGVADMVELTVRLQKPKSAEAVQLQGTLKEMMDRHERGLIERALAASGGNRTRAADKLGLSRQALSVKLTKYRL
jgi:transcriptional regulator with GAF, ATPase, and Fis domain